MPPIARLSANVVLVTRVTPEAAAQPRTRGIAHDQRIHAPQTAARGRNGTASTIPATGAAPPRARPAFAALCLVRKEHTIRQRDDPVQAADRSSLPSAAV